MSTKSSTRLRTVSGRALAVLAIVTVLSLASPSAFADIPLNYNINGGSAIFLGTGTGFALNSGGGLSFTIQANTVDPTGTGLGGNGTSAGATSDLNTLTFAITNSTTSPGSVTLGITGQNFTVGGAGANDSATFSVSGTSSHSSTGDSVTVTSLADTANGMFTGASIPPAAGLSGTVPTPSTTTASTYSFTNGGLSGSLTFTNLGTFSLTQFLTINLAAGDNASITISSTVVPSAVPEPSTMALACLGAMGLVGYGLRRRKTLGA